MSLGGAFPPKINLGAGLTTRVIINITIIFCHNILKLVRKKTVLSKIWSGFWMGMVCPRRLSFSGLTVMLTERDNLQTVPIQKPLPIFEITGFFLASFNILWQMIIVIWSDWSWAMLPRTEIYRKLKWRRVSQIGMFPVIVTVISSSFVKNALNHSLNQAVLKHT